MKSTLNRDYNQMHIPTQVDNAKLNEFFDNIDNLNLSQIDLIHGKYNLYTRDLNNNTILHRVINNSLNEKHLIKTIKLLPELAKLINFTDNEGRTPLHLLCINQYYETYNVINDILDGKKEKDNIIDMKEDIDLIEKEERDKNISLNEGIDIFTGGNDKDFNYYVLDKYNKLPSSYLCEGINLTQLGKSLKDLKIYNIIIPEKTIPNDYDDNAIFINNDFIRDIFFFIKLLHKNRFKIKVNDYIDDYKKSFTLLNNEYIEYYRNNNFYNEVHRLMMNKNIYNAPMYQHSKINKMIEDDYNKKIINNIIINDSNNYWFLITNYIYKKMNLEEKINYISNDIFKDIIRLIYKLKIQSVLDKTNSNILCKKFNDFYNKLLSENHYLLFLLYIIDNNNDDDIELLFNIIKEIIQQRQIIINELQINDDRNNNLPDLVLEDENIKNQYEEYYIDIFTNITDDTLFNFITELSGKKHSYIILVLINNITSNKTNTFNTFYSKMIKAFLLYDKTLNETKSINEFKSEFTKLIEYINNLDEDIEYYYDINKSHIHYEIINNQ